MMRKDKRFAILAGKAFLHELQAERRDTAIAFGRAFLLALGYENPADDEEFPALNGRGTSQSMAAASH